MNYKVSVIEGEKKITIQDCALKLPSEKQVLVKIEACAICTLEQRFYTGVMNRYPFAGGHEAAGIVQEVGEGVKSVKPGDKVAIRLLNSCGECYYCRNGNENQCVVSFVAKTQDCAMGPGGLAEYMIVESKSVYKVSDDVDLKYAALTEPLACCVHSIRNGSIMMGDDVVVVGVGIMGALHIQLAKLRGARVIACEIDSTRLEIAKQMGADILINSAEEDVVQTIKDCTEGRGADVVFCTVAIADTASQCLDMAGKLGRVVYYSSIHPDKPIEFSANKVHSTEQIITGSVNPQISDFAIASRLISNKLVNLESLISAEVPFDRIQEAFEIAIDPAAYRVIVNC